jgi:hypothetical protein
MRLCRKCKVEKDDNQFGKLKCSKDGINPRCRQCCCKSVKESKKSPEAVANKNFMFLNGKNKIERNGLNKVVLGIKEIWKKQGKCLLKRLENISILSGDAKKEMKELLNGIGKIQKKKSA